MNVQAQTEAAPTNSRKSLAVKLLVGVVAAVALIFLGRQLGAYVPQFAQWVDGLGFWGPAVFVLGYAAATLAFVPGSLLTMAAGAIFGLAKGTVLVFFGATLGSTFSFLVARYLARSAIERRLADRPRFRAIDKAVARQGLKIVFLVRLSPVFPYNLLNYGLGLTRVRLLDYVLACFGMIPGTFLYVYYGKALGSLAAVAGGVAPERGPGDWILLGVGLAATVAVTAFVTRIARRALKEEVEEDE
ncbi:MAG: TVP38/TMEM64 family protein [Thermoanaerobaculia bacterium]